MLVILNDYALTNFMDIIPHNKKISMYIYIDMYLYIHPSIHACIHAYIHTCIHTYIHYIHTYNTYITLHYITLHTFHFITLHYIKLHYITYMHTYIYIYVYMYIYININISMYTWFRIRTDWHFCCFVSTWGISPKQTMLLRNVRLGSKGFWDFQWVWNSETLTYIYIYTYSIQCEAPQL